MNSLGVLFLIVASATATPFGQIVSVSQDTLGKYDLKFIVDGIARSEHRDELGNVAGGFIYTDPHGIQRKTIFTSGVEGFNPVSADIPVPVVDTPEVKLAKAQHLAFVNAERSRQLIADIQDKRLVYLTVPELNLVKSSELISIPFLKNELNDLVHVNLEKLLKFHVMPVPVLENEFLADTPEVTLAKIKHFAAHAAARANLLNIQDN